VHDRKKKQPTKRAPASHALMYNTLRPTEEETHKKQHKGESGSKRDGG